MKKSDIDRKRAKSRKAALTRIKRKLAAGDHEEARKTLNRHIATDATWLDGTHPKLTKTR